MIRYSWPAVLLVVLTGCAAQGSNGQEQAQEIAVNYCEREGGEVVTRQEGSTSRQYCHLVEGRVVEVNRLYRGEGLRAIDQ
ncbi:DUF333 domain-containing protein [Vreelandella sp. EE22]